MIPKLSEKFGNKIHLDNTLFDLSVIPLDSNATPLQFANWINGISKANNLTLDIVDNLFILKNKDFAQVQLLEIGKPSETFRATAQSLGWDIFELDGFTLVEFPVAHLELVKTLSSIQSIHYEFQLNLSLYNSNDTNAKGIQVNDFINFSINNFDIMNFNQPVTKINLPSLSLSHDHIKYLQENSYSITLTCRSGHTATQRIDKQSNFLTTQKDALGQVTNQSIQTFTSGFIINLTANPRGSEALLSVDLELSEDVSTSTDILPVISRRSVQNHSSLTIGDTWLMGKFELTADSSEDRKSFFTPYRNKKANRQVMIIVCRRIR